jgi:hypothetical protein
LFRKTTEIRLIFLTFVKSFLPAKIPILSHQQNTKIMTKAIPVFRVFDYKKTVEFYIDWLGFTIDWEYRPAGSPFFIQVSIRGIAIRLSEHHGDCSPGAKLFISDYEGLAAYHQLISQKDFKYMNPGLERPEWDEETITTTVIDPFSNQIIFTEMVGKP